MGMSIHEWIQQGSVSEEIAEKRGLKELVRCKDCKYFEPDGIYTMCYRHNGLSPNEDWFCADGKKKGSKE